MKKWFYAINNEQKGPVDEEMLVSLIGQGIIKPGTLVWTQGMKDWVRAGDTDAFSAHFGSSAPPQFQNDDDDDPFKMQQTVKTSPASGTRMSGRPPENHLVKSILVTLFCCLPLGIAAIYYSAQVNSTHQAGDHESALEFSQKADKFGNYSIIASVGFIILYLIFFFAVGISTY